MMDTGNQIYVKIFDAAVEVSFSQKEKLLEYPFLIQKGTHFEVPSHFFGCLSKTQKGSQFIKPIVQSILKNLQNTHGTTKLRETLLALGHALSTEITSDLIIQCDVLTNIVEYVQKSSSYVLRGTLINALSLMHIGPEHTDTLNSLKLCQYRISDYSVIIPEDFDEFVRFKVPPLSEYPAVAQFDKIELQFDCSAYALNSCKMYSLAKQVSMSFDTSIPNAKEVGLVNTLFSHYPEVYLSDKELRTYIRISRPNFIPSPL
jgi:hypothetical protein